MSREETPEHQLSEEELRVLVLPATTTDGLAIRKVLLANTIGCEVLGSMSLLAQALSVAAGVVLISEEHLQTEFSELLAVLKRQPVWSDVPIIVLGGAGRQSALLEQLVSGLGNVTVIERPMQMLTLVSVVRASLRARRRQYDVREHFSEQHAAQRQIREAEQRYRLLIENIRDYAIFVVDPNGCVASWNSGAQKILGYSLEEALGLQVDAFFSVEDRDNKLFEREMAEARTNGRATSAGWRIRKDGEQFSVEGVLTAIRDDDGLLIGYAKFMRDVTEWQRAQTERERLFESERTARAEAELAGRMKDEFLATLSHELRTPLHAVLGWSNVLRRLDGLPPKALDGLSTIERNARSQAKIIEDLLDMSAIISGKVRLDVQRVELAAVLGATIETVRPAAEAKGVRLHVMLDPLVRAVSGDPNRLQQIFWNLLTNAVKFTPKLGRVSVTLERVNSHVEANITDTGEGIDPNFLPHVFDRFRQADATTTRRHGGLGLGLSIVKQLVELHGGQISAKSAGPGKGASFRVTLPIMVTSVHPDEERVRREHPARSQPEEHALDTSQPDLTGSKILVVDDEADARALIRRLLDECGAIVSTASSASEALTQIEASPPNLLISDIGLPHEDGYSLIQRIRGLPGRIGTIPAIALTAYARVEDRIRVIQAGYQVHLAKPVEPVELLAMAASLLERGRE